MKAFLVIVGSGVAFVAAVFFFAALEGANAAYGDAPAAIETAAR